MSALDRALQLVHYAELSMLLTIHHFATTRSQSVLKPKLQTALNKRLKYSYWFGLSLTSTDCVASSQKLLQINLYQYLPLFSLLQEKVGRSYLPATDMIV